MKPFNSGASLTILLSLVIIYEYNKIYILSSIMAVNYFGLFWIRLQYPPSQVILIGARDRLRGRDFRKQ